jgi:glucokinase
VHLRALGGERFRKFRYRIFIMNKFSIGVDLGGTNLRIAAVDEQGNLLEKVSLGTKLSLGRARVIDDMCDAIQRVSQKYNSAPLLGIGIGVPGIVDLENGMMRAAVNLTGWGNYPARAEIERRLQTRVILENDGNVAALGEKWLGAARDFSDMAMLTLGTGVGGGLVLGGVIWHGVNGMAGEFGHITVAPDGPLCGCGNRGCLELYASATAIVRMAREAAASNPGSALALTAKAGPVFSAESIYNLAIRGDEDARRIFQQVGRSLGIALSTLLNVLNLPIYVIGGGAASAWDAFAPALFAELRQRSVVYTANDSPDPAPNDPPATDPPMNDPSTSPLVKSGAAQKTIVARALLGSDAGLYGAAWLPMIAKLKQI